MIEKMTIEELYEVLKKNIKQGDCFNKEIQDILFNFKNSGRQQETAQKLVERLAVDFSDDETLQDRAYDILDIVSGCNAEMRVWDKQEPGKLIDGLQFEDDESGVIFNHFSFCELVKYIMVKYGKINYESANKRLINSHLAKIPGTIKDVEFLTHELEFHWAMLLVHGDMYWTKGIHSDFNEFADDYYKWEAEIKQKHNLKISYEYYDKFKQ